MTRPQKLAALAELGYPVTRWGALGVRLSRPPYFLTWRGVGPFLKRRKAEKMGRLAVLRTLEHLAVKQPAAWEARRAAYLESAGRREV